MISLKSKFFKSKMLWGILFVISGISKLISYQYSGSWIQVFFDIISYTLFGTVLLIGILSRKQTIEPEDELAILHQKKAKVFIYDLIYIVTLVYLVVGRPFTFTINVGVAFIVLGVFQILEYLFFEYFEKKELRDYE